jgi:hypothetical protein
MHPQHLLLKTSTIPPPPLTCAFVKIFFEASTGSGFEKCFYGSKVVGHPSEQAASGILRN